MTQFAWRVSISFSPPDETLVEPPFILKSFLLGWYINWSPLPLGQQSVCYSPVLPTYLTHPHRPRGMWHCDLGQPSFVWNEENGCTTVVSEQRATLPQQDQQNNWQKNFGAGQSDSILLIPGLDLSLSLFDGMCLYSDHKIKSDHTVL